MKKFLLFLAILIDIVSAANQIGYAMMAVIVPSPRARKLSPHSSSHNVVMKSPHLTAIPESEQKQETEQKAASQPVAVKASQPIVADASELVRKAEEDLGKGARVCDAERLAAALSVVKDANVLVDTVNNRTALHKIVEVVVDTEKEQQEQEACIKLLLKCGAKIDQQDNLGYSPLHLAASCANLVCVKFLVSQGAAVNSRRFNIGWTPLFVAVVFSGVRSIMPAVRPFIDTIDWLITYGGADYTLNGGFELGSKMSEDMRTPFEAARWDEVKICIQKAVVINKIVQAAIQSAHQEFSLDQKVADVKKVSVALQKKLLRERFAAMRAFEREFGDDDDI
jgi:hypothetical protein